MKEVVHIEDMKWYKFLPRAWR